jgi:hypothetical protein
VKIEPTSEVRLATIKATTNANTSHKIVHTLLARKKQPTCIHQIMYWIIRESLYLCTFASNYYSHTSSNW